MNFKNATLHIAFVLTTGQALAINKCTTTDGKVAFQDTPCAGAGKNEKIEVRPASGNIPAALGASAAGKVPISEAERLNALTAASQNDRRRIDLRDRLVPSAKAMLSQNTQQCAQKQEQLAAEQYRYVQNLYGKTHAAQAASEMAAAAAICATKDRDLRDTLDKLQVECTAADCMRF